VDDLAEALVFLMRNYSDAQHINVGYGNDVTIRELAELTAKIVGFTGNIVQDATKPDGTPQKLLDVNKLTHMGWKAKTSLQNGLTAAYAWYIDRQP
jgi:GDP-L-fucose synthase